MRRSEPVSVEKLWDELWIEVKYQSNSEIAGSPRNSLRASPTGSVVGVRLWIGTGAKAYQA